MTQADGKTPKKSLPGSSRAGRTTMQDGDLKVVAQVKKQENPDGEAQWFGRRPVRPSEKTGLVRGVFDSVAERYDLMNDLMSGGIHRLWKDRFVRRIRPYAGYRYVDVAGGTGDIAFRIRHQTGEGGHIHICDINENMLRTGRSRAIDRGWINEFLWSTGDAETLPLPDESYDVYTIAFGLRNVTRIDTALKEAARVLKKGGRFYCLEFSHPQIRFLERAYDFYSRLLIPKMGKIVARDEESYQYLIESIAAFPDQPALAQRIENAGFERVRWTNLSGGIAAIHEGWKI